MSALGQKATSACSGEQRSSFDKIASRFPAPVLHYHGDGLNRVGDRVEIIGGRLDPNLPCAYIPNLITRDLSQ
jgi:hypothetical protein